MVFFVIIKLPLHHPWNISCSLLQGEHPLISKSKKRIIVPAIALFIFLEETLNASLPDCLIGKVRLNMNETLAATLGELQAQIYWLHDAEDFTELASAAATIYMKLGYTQQQAETAGNLISQAYQLADDAALAQKAGNFDQEMQFYYQAKDKLTQVETTLVYQTSIAIHQMKWWMYFRHKQKLKILLHLFLQNFQAVGLINLLTALKLTYFLMEIGRVHKLRDIETTKHNAIKYWTELLKIKPPQYPYLG